LELAAKVIHGLNLSESAMKTRIRRLYDIANILQSLKLIQKVTITEPHGGKKPAFQYIGPVVDGIGEILQVYVCVLLQLIFVELLIREEKLMKSLFLLLLCLLMINYLTFTLISY